VVLALLNSKLFPTNGIMFQITALAVYKPDIYIYILQWLCVSDRSQSDVVSLFWLTVEILWQPKALFSASLLTGLPAFHSLFGC